MKKIVYLILICAFLILLVSCGGSSDQGGESDVYEKLNEMVGEDYSSLTAEISTALSDQSLTSRYEIANFQDGKRIDYSIERLSGFEEVNGEYVIPDSYRTVYTGYVVISKGAVVERGGDEVELNNIELPDFSFNQEYFDNCDESTDGRFSASVTNPSAFLNKSINCSDMTLTVLYGEDIRTIILNYVSQTGTYVGVEYSFTK